MQIGVKQRLQVIRESPHGLFLTDGSADVLLPTSQIPADAKLGDDIEVFIYTDSEDRPIATRKTPLAEAGSFALLKVVSVTPLGAFLDWGLDKDLFCPLREQRQPMNTGEEWVVHVYFDKVSQRMVCSARIGRFLEKSGSGLRVGAKVKILVYGLGRNWTDVVVDDRYKGAIFPDEWIEELDIGDEREAFIKQIRGEDGKIAISLRPQGFRAVQDEAENLLQKVRKNGGWLPLSDRSTPEEIYQELGLSKGAFKKLIGGLYREGRLTIEQDQIRLR